MSRKLYLEHAFPSMFAFCTERFRMSEAMAAKRIRAGRAACRFPCILDMVASGELHLSGVHQLAGYLTKENHQEVLRRAKHRTMREIEGLIAEIAPKADVPASVRALPVGRAGGMAARGTSVEGVAEARLMDAGVRGDAHAETKAPPVERREIGPEPSLIGAASPVAAKPRGAATPLSPRRYKLQVTIGQEGRERLAELQGLLSHQIPDGDPAAIVERALEVLLAETKKKKAALTNKPRARSGVSATRAIPAKVRRKVFERDDGQCAYRDAKGRRCGSTWKVEFHHKTPYAKGGSHSADNMELRCRGHNQYEAELDFGERFMARRREAVRGRLDGEPRGSPDYLPS